MARRWWVFTFVLLILPCVDDFEHRLQVIAECKRLAGMKDVDVPADDIAALTCVARVMIDDKSVVMKYCAAIAKVCVNVSNRVKCGEAVLQTVLDMLRAHADDVDIANAGTYALLNACANCKENAMTLVRLGGLDVVKTAAERHVSASVSAARWCCTILSRCAYHPETRDAALAVGGVNIVSTAMDAHQGDAELQRRGCIALRNFAGTSAAHKSAVLSVVIGLTGEARVRRALARFPDDVEVRVQGEGALKAMGKPLTV
jgi:hypothetical protein